MTVLTWWDLSCSLPTEHLLSPGDGTHDFEATCSVKARESHQGSTVRKVIEWVHVEVDAWHLRECCQKSAQRGPSDGPTEGPTTNSFKLRHVAFKRRFRFGYIYSLRGYLDANKNCRTSNTTPGRHNSAQPYWSIQYTGGLLMAEVFLHAAAKVSTWCWLIFLVRRHLSLSSRIILSVRGHSTWKSASKGGESDHFFRIVYMYLESSISYLNPYI